MAVVGQQLKQPEAGWKRIDDSSNLIVYSSDFLQYTDTSYYNSTRHSTQTAGQTAKLYFYGTRIRVIGARNSADSTNVKIIIDDEEFTYSQYASQLIPQALVFEKVGLSKGYHTITILATEPNKYVTIDAFDIDVDGEMVGDLPNVKTLIKTSTEFFYYESSDSTFKQLGHEPTSQDFLDYGMDKLTDKQLQNFEAIYGKQYRILHWTDGKPVTKAKLKAIPQYTSALPSGDIPLFGVDKLDSVTVTATGGGYIAISVDSGVTWKTFSGGQWVTISDISQGMTFAEFNALTSQQLKVIRGDSNTIRFAYHLTGNTVIDKIEMRVTLIGIPEFANKKDYDMSYDPSTKTITYVINKSGQYIVNYTNT